MTHPGTMADSGEPVARQEGPLRWAVEVGTSCARVSAAVEGHLPQPTACPQP